MKTFIYKFFMQPRQSIIEIFSTFVLFDADRFSTWVLKLAASPVSIKRVADAGWESLSGRLCTSVLIQPFCWVASRYDIVQNKRVGINNTYIDPLFK